MDRYDQLVSAALTRAPTRVIRSLSLAGRSDKWQRGRATFDRATIAQFRMEHPDLHAYDGADFGVGYKARASFALALCSGIHPFVSERVDRETDVAADLCGVPRGRDRSARGRHGQRERLDRLVRAYDNGTDVSAATNITAMTYASGRSRAQTLRSWVDDGRDVLTYLGRFDRT